MQLTFVFPFNGACLREGIQGLLGREQRLGGRGVRSGAKRGGETSSRASLTQGFGSRAKKTSGRTTGGLPQWGSVQLGGSHTQCQARSQPAQHPSARVGPQVSPCSGLLLRLAAAVLCLPSSIFFSLAFPSFPLDVLSKGDEKKFSPLCPHHCVPATSVVWKNRLQDIHILDF